MSKVFDKWIGPLPTEEQRLVRQILKASGTEPQPPFPWIGMLAMAFVMALGLFVSLGIQS